MTPFARQFDEAQYDPKHYYRGMEILREMTVDDGDFDDDYEEHCAAERAAWRYV